MSEPGLQMQAAPGWQKLSAGGRPVADLHDRLTTLIARRLGPQAANLLACPTNGGWVSTSGQALRLPRDAVERARLAEMLVTRRGAILGLADQMDRQGEVGEIAAHALRLAMMTPEDGETLATDGENPVLLFWGSISEGQPVPDWARPTETGTEAPPPEQPMIGADPPPRSSVHAMLWLVPAGLAIGLGWLVWMAATPLPPQIVEIVPPAPAAADPTGALPDAVARLDAALEEALAAGPRFAAACVAPAEPATVAAAPPEETAAEPIPGLAPESSAAPPQKPRIARPARPARPTLPKPPVVAKKQPDAPERAPPAPARTLRDVIASRDIRGIEGCWRQDSPHRRNGQDTGLTNARLCFDENGRGTARYNVAGGLRGAMRCTEPIRAFFSGDRMVLRSGGTQTCRGAFGSKRQSLAQREALCRLSGASSRCSVASTGVTYRLVR